MHVLTNEQESHEVVRYLDDGAFDYYYNTFALEGTLIPEASNYDHMKAVLMRQFEKDQNLQDVIFFAMSASLDPTEFGPLLYRMNALIWRAALNDKADFALLGEAVMSFPDLT